MKDEKITNDRLYSWAEIEEFEKSNDLSKMENLFKLAEMGFKLDYSTIPDDVNINNEEWLREKAEAKAAAAKKKLEE